MYMTIIDNLLNKALSSQIVTDRSQYANTKQKGAVVKMITGITYALDNTENFAVQTFYLDFSIAFDLI